MEGFDEPLIDVSTHEGAYDKIVTNNPAVCVKPDGSILIVYKAVGDEFKLPVGGPVVHLAATSDSPIGPMKKHEGLMFHYEGERFGARIHVSGTKMVSIVLL